MKIRIQVIIVSFITLSFLQCTAQEWFPLGAKWTNDFYAGFFGIPGYQIVTVKKDTAINGIQCRMLQFIYESCSGNIHDSTEQYMYEDSNKVYYLLDNEFALLYDFNSQPGNSWTVATNDICGPDAGTVIIDSVYFKLVNGLQIKEMRVTGSMSNWGYPFQGIITEYIGSGTYLIPNQHCISDGGGYHLRCYEDSILGEYNISGFPCEGCIASIEDKIKEQAISLSPNPVHAQLHINLTNPNLTLQSLKLLTLEGRELFSKPEILSANFTLSTSKYPSGLYLVRITLTNGQALVKKVVIE